MTATQVSYALKLIVPVLDSLNIDYWIARGTLRNLYLRGDLGDQDTDVDFHIRTEDADKVRTGLVDALKSEYKNLQEPDLKSYKLAFCTPKSNNPKNKYDMYVDFMFIQNDETDLGYVFHARNDGGRRYAPKECFPPKNQTYLKFNNLKLRIPANTQTYLLGTYGKNWKENIKEDKRFTSSPQFLRNNPL